MPDQPAVLRHQQYQGMPRLGAPFVNPDGTVSISWYRWLISIWIRAGKGFSEQANSVFASMQGDGTISLYNSNTGGFLGSPILSGGTPQPAQPQTVGSSPFTFTAIVAGTLIVFAAMVELSRDSGLTWYQVTLNGGAVPLLKGDQARVTWYNPTSPPVITFFPSL